MLTARGRAKVMDFGLAKVIQQKSLIESEAETQSLLTEPGMIVGTVPYMSPEQVKGEPVDVRSDLFSFGAVLYEVITGRQPFAAESAGATCSAILVSVPPPLARYTREAPAELERIVTKALEKDREERYQTAKDLLVDLRRLRKRLEIEAELELSSPPAVSHEIQMPESRESAAVKTQDCPPVSTSEAGGVPAVSSAEYVLSEIKRHKTSAALILAALVIVLAGLGYGLYKLTNQRQTISSTQAMKIMRLTATSNANWAAISPDGKYVVYSLSDERGQQSVWVKHVVTASNVPITPPSEDLFVRLTFTHDGNYIYFLKLRKSSLPSLYRMPALGGVEQKVVENVSSRAALSPDDKRIAFIRGVPPNETSLILAN